MSCVKGIKRRTCLHNFCIFFVLKFLEIDEFMWAFSKSMGASAPAPFASDLTMPLLFKEEIVCSLSPLFGSFFTPSWFVRGVEKNPMQVLSISFGLYSIYLNKKGKTRWTKLPFPIWSHGIYLEGHVQCTHRYVYSKWYHWLFLSASLAC